MKYFTESELADKETGICRLAPATDTYPGFGVRMDALREAWGGPLVVNSCCRSKARNEQVGGHYRSLHVYDFPYHPTGGSCAVDFRLFPTEAENNAFKDLAYSMQFSIGNESGCIHVDDRKPLLGMQQTRFIYTTVPKQ